MSKRAPRKKQSTTAPKEALLPTTPLSLAALEAVNPAKSGPPPWMRVAVGLAEPLSVAGLLAFVLWKSWLRWPDPLIDFPRDLYVAWRVSEGDKLYEKVASWYGPLSHLVQGAGFRLFGVGLDTMVWMNIGLMVGVLLLLRAIFGQIGNRLSVWTISVVFIVVFGCGQLTNISNYNFITPYVAQATYAFTGLLVVIWGVLRHLKSDRLRWLAVAGSGLAVAYLDKPEGATTAAGVVGFYLVARVLQVARQNKPRTDWLGAGRWAVRACGWLAVGFFAMWLPVFVYFLFAGGMSYALLAADFVPYSVVHAYLSGTMAHSPQIAQFSGWDHPWPNFLKELLAGGWLVVVCGMMVLAGWGLAGARRFGVAWWSCLLAMAGACGFGVWLGFRDNAWVDVGGSLAFPVTAASLLAAAWGLHVAWHRRENFGQVLGVAVVAVAGGLMLSRIGLAARLNQYGFFLMPLAAMFWIHLMLIEAPRLAIRKSPGNSGGVLPSAFAFLVLVGVGQLLRVDLEVYGDKTLEVGAGRDHFYTFPWKPLPGRLGNTRGLLLNSMMDEFRARTPRARTLVAFPEGIALNYHLRVPTTLAELDFDPFALSFFGRERVLAELAAHPPDAIYVHFRNMTEFGVNYFGESDLSGSAILEWIEQNYRLIDKAGAAPTKSGDALDLYVPRVLSGAPIPTTAITTDLQGGVGPKGRPAP